MIQNIIPFFPDLLRFKVLLKNIRPPIWRRVDVPETLTLAEFHDVIQIAMGWTNSHLHMFEIKGRPFSPRCPEADWDEPEGEDTAAVTLKDLRLRRKGQKFSYVYDFGDGWDHEITTEGVVQAEPGVSYPRCVTGRRACPPENSGGPWGYARMLAIVNDPQHDEHDDMIEWLGDEFDPAAFDLAETNEALGAEGP